MFDIHKSPVDEYGEWDSGSVEEYCQGLTDEFAESPEGAATAERHREVGWAYTFLDLGFSYLGLIPPEMSRRDVEEILFKHPKVAMAAVVGVPDQKAGEMVKAYIQLKPGMEATVEEIAEFCKENMAGYKRPRAIEFRDSLPTSPIGKVLRRVLKEEEMSKA